MPCRAVASALMKMLHLSAVIRDRYSNPDHGHRLKGLLVLSCEMRNVNSHLQMTIVMQHKNFKGVELYCVEQFA